MDVIIISYPKSGSTWLCRLLGDYLDFPTGALMDGHDQGCFCTEGQNRKGKGKVRQAHAVPVDEGNVLAPGSHKLNPKYLDGKIVFMVRDPRDVAVSVKHHWKIHSIREVLEKMGKGEWPLTWGHGWNSFIETWLDSGLIDFMTSYEALKDDAVNELCWFTYHTGIRAEKAPEEVVRRQAFDHRREWTKAHGDSLTYGKEAQLKFLRRGIVGDWQNVFTEEDSKRACELFGETAGRIGYDLR